MKTIAITIDEETLRLLDRLASRQGKGRHGLGNRSQIVRQAVSEYLARREQAEREEAEWKTWSRNLERINRQAAALIEEQAEP